MIAILGYLSLPIGVTGVGGMMSTVFHSKNCEKQWRGPFFQVDRWVSNFSPFLRVVRTNREKWGDRADRFTISNQRGQSQQHHEIT